MKEKHPNNRMIIMRVLINEVGPNLDATPTTLLHDQDRVPLLVAVAGGQK